MSKENSKKLYDHYVEIGYTKAAQNLLAKYPDFEAVKQVKKAAKKEEAAEEEQKD